MHKKTSAVILNINTEPELHSLCLRTLYLKRHQWVTVAWRSSGSTHTSLRMSELLNLSIAWCRLKDIEMLTDFKNMLDHGHNDKIITVLNILILRAHTPDDSVQDTGPHTLK